MPRGLGAAPRLGAVVGLAADPAGRPTEGSAEGLPGGSLWAGSTATGWLRAGSLGAASTAVTATGASATTTGMLVTPTVAAAGRSFNKVSVAAPPARATPGS